MRKPELPRHDAVAEAALISPPGTSAAGARLHDRLAALGDVVVEHVAATGSTNTDLLERYREPSLAALLPVLRSADVQTAGRGRLGRRWHGEAGASLAFSLALPMARADLSGLSLAVGVALAEAIEDLAREDGAPPAPPTPFGIGLKWPNDLCLVDNSGNAADAAADAADDPAAWPWRKLGGILIETTPWRGGRIVVIGVGLNLAAHDTRDAPRSAGLRERISGATPAGVLAATAPAVLGTALTFERDGFDASLQRRYAARDLLAGRAVRAASPRSREGLAIEGRAAGIAADGALLVRQASGELLPVSSGEVSLRPCRDAAEAPC